MPKMKKITGGLPHVLEEIFGKESAAGFIAESPSDKILTALQADMPRLCFFPTSKGASQWSFKDFFYAWLSPAINSYTQGSTDASIISKAYFQRMMGQDSVRHYFFDKALKAGFVLASEGDSYADYLRENENLAFSFFDDNGALCGVSLSYSSIDSRFWNLSIIRNTTAAVDKREALTVSAYPLSKKRGNTGDFLAFLRSKTVSEALRPLFVKDSQGNMVISSDEEALNDITSRLIHPSDGEKKRIQTRILFEACVRKNKVRENFINNNERAISIELARYKNVSSLQANFDKKNIGARLDTLNKDKRSIRRNFRELLSIAIISLFFIALIAALPVFGLSLSFIVSAAAALTLGAMLIFVKIVLDKLPRTRYRNAAQATINERNETSNEITPASHSQIVLDYEKKLDELYESVCEKSSHLYHDSDITAVCEECLEILPHDNLPEDFNLESVDEVLERGNASVEAAALSKDNTASSSSSSSAPDSPGKQP